MFKPFSRPHAIACLDDDRDFLELLAMALPSEWNAHYFCKTQSFIDFIRQNTVMGQRDYALVAKVFQAERSSEHAIMQILRYWQHNPQRWSVCDLGVLDYAMPKMTGLQVLELLPDWHGKRMLLTGVADEKIAVQAFNQNLIHQYIAKQSEDVVDKLTHAVTELSSALNAQYQSLVFTQLNDAQVSMLRHESAACALSAFAEDHWVEYIVLGDPFGVLGLSRNGQLSWLQLERSCDLDDLKAIAMSESWPTEQMQAIRRGNVLPNSLLRQALGSQSPAAVAPVMPFGDNSLIGALFEFDLPMSLQTGVASITYSEWFDANTSGLIRD
jgi:CheY-like chemotaxis protein